MFTTMSSQMYHHEQELSTTGQRAEMVRVGEIAANVRDLRLRLRNALRPLPRLRPARRAAGAATARVRILSGVR